MIVDLHFSQMRRMAVKGGTLLKLETEERVKFFLVSNSPIIYRSIMSRPRDAMEYQIMMATMPTSISVLNVIEPHRIEMQILELLNSMNLKLDGIDKLLSDQRIPIKELT